MPCSQIQEHNGHFQVYSSTLRYSHRSRNPKNFLDPHVAPEAGEAGLAIHLYQLEIWLNDHIRLSARRRSGESIHDTNSIVNSNTKRAAELVAKGRSEIGQYRLLMPFADSL